MKCQSSLIGALMGRFVGSNPLPYKSSPTWWEIVTKSKIAACHSRKEETSSIFYLLTRFFFFPMGLFWLLWLINLVGFFTTH
jgi:hypothetical protein